VISPTKWGAIATKPQKAHSCASPREPSSVKIRRRVWPVGEFPKKRYKFKKSLYFTHLPRSPPCTDLHQIWHSHRGRRRNHTYQIFGGRLRGVDSVGVENCRLPLTRPVAVNTGLALARKKLSCRRGTARRAGSHHHHRYDTTRDAILTCARKPT